MDEVKITASPTRFRYPHKSFHKQDWSRAVLKPVLPCTLSAFTLDASRDSAILNRSDGVEACHNSNREKKQCGKYKTVREKVAAS
jgi:hypothetical protein